MNREWKSECTIKLQSYINSCFMFICHFEFSLTDLGSGKMGALGSSMLLERYKQERVVLREFLPYDLARIVGLYSIDESVIQRCIKCQVIFPEQSPVGNFVCRKCTQK